MKKNILIVAMIFAMTSVVFSGGQYERWEKEFFLFKSNAINVDELPNSEEDVLREWDSLIYKIKNQHLYFADIFEKSGVVSGVTGEIYYIISENSYIGIIPDDEFRIVFKLVGPDLPEKYWISYGFDTNLFGTIIQLVDGENSYVVTPDYEYWNRCMYIILNFFNSDNQPNISVIEMIQDMSRSGLI